MICGIDRAEAQELVDSWVQGWNAQDRFEVLGVYVGVGSLVINYRNQNGGLVSEVLIFEGRLVTQGHGTYLGTDANPAGATSR